MACTGLRDGGGSMYPTPIVSRKDEEKLGN